MKIRDLLVVCLLLAIAAAACRPGVSEIRGAERDVVLAYADPIADGLLQGLNDNDYQTYSRDFDEAMRKALPESKLPQNREAIVSKIGLYVSREPQQVLTQGQFTTVIYEAKFEEEDGVEVKVVFREVGGENRVAGLWFNSPKLRR